MTAADSAWPDVGRVGEALRELHVSGGLDLPLPGSGRTRERWRALAEMAAQDLSVARLAEAHTDAVAILDELAVDVPEGALLGVWAAEPPGSPVVATLSDGTWHLTGRKPWCSGASVLDAALVSAVAEDGRRLFMVREWQVVDGTWSAVGMAASGSTSVDLDTAAVPVGGPMAYLERAGFWHGAMGVAACWYGGAVGVARVLLQAARAKALDPHALAHLGAVDGVLSSLDALLDATAAQVDADPLDRKGEARLAAMRLRAAVEAGCTEVLDRVGRALGPGPMCTDAAHARRVADLPVYLRQSHAERDLAALGGLAAERATW